MDLTGSNGTATLTFDHAYAYYENAGDIFYDSLRIDYSVDCGATWEQIWINGYETLATAAPSSAAFVPTDADWVNNTVDINGLPSSGEMLVRFVGLTGYGNNLFIDNINLSSTVATKDLLKLDAFTIQPNPAVDRAEVKFTLPTSDDMRMHVYAADGTLVQSQELGSLVSGQHSVQIDAARLTNGSYRVVLQGAKGVAQSHLVILK
ncbi:MAG: hypothetical protein IT269_07615 [Saprospiraceae bacterium]|nr:hypothetical protein [Saprospiraceae bacterium]